MEIDSTAIVTGGSRGIGLSIVKKLMEDGWNIIVLSRTYSDELKSAGSAQKSVSLNWVQMDLADSSSIKSAVSESSKITKNIGLLVNCAGVAQGSAFLMTKVEELVNVFNVNYFNTLYLSQLIAKKMIRKKSGVIINILSVAGLSSEEGTVAYGGSKAALTHSTRVLATELGKFSIRVNGIAPAIVETDMGALNDIRAIQRNDDRSAITGKIYPEDIAELVSFVASNAASKITGQILKVDRGLH